MDPADGAVAALAFLMQGGFKDSDVIVVSREFRWAPQPMFEIGHRITMVLKSLLSLREGGVFDADDGFVLSMKAKLAQLRSQRQAAQVF